MPSQKYDKKLDPRLKRIVSSLDNSARIDQDLQAGAFHHSSRAVFQQYDEQCATLNRQKPALVVQGKAADQNPM